MFDIEQIREDIHDYGTKIFVNSAGASLNPAIVNQTINNYLKEEELYGGYLVEEMRKEQVEQFYDEAAKLINTKSSNIAFASDATNAYIKALSAIPFEKGDLVITSNDDYSSNQILFLSLQKRYGITIKRIKNLENGDLDINNFTELIDSQRPKLIAITHIPTNSGMIQNVEAIGRICSDKDILFLLDACQSVGQIEVDVKNIKCDFLSTTGRKFQRGPRGTGFLYVSDKALSQGYAPLYADGFGGTWIAENKFELLDNARRFETWERPHALIEGYAMALNYANTIGMQNIEKYNNKLLERLRSNLDSIAAVNVYDQGSKKASILTFRKSGLSLEYLHEFLWKNNVICGISSFEWGVIDYDKKGIDGTIRISPHYFNTLEEMDLLSEIIDQA